MSLPIPDSYLAMALQKECQLEKLTLKHQEMCNLSLPTGELVACDPLVFCDTEPFSLLLPRGIFPVILSIAHSQTDQRVAFATIRFRDSTPVAWDMMTIEGQDTETLEPGHFFGYGVDAGTGCFMDRSAARALDNKMKEDNDFGETLIDEMQKTYRHTWSWLDLKLGNANLVAFSSGYGDGTYATYAGFDADKEISVVVTDFGVVRIKE